ncbi:MAG: putative transcriptional regulator, Crp/Fnr family [Xanthobacteraceae bacterium]|jgi:CRP-like cAMP-binding protein|nr:putative transcriptional regulator, Crp/Fnr family [Xanthobacteraceae bacterium]
MSIENDIALLNGIPMLALLGPEALRIIAISAESRIVRGGDILFREGQAADSAYLVVSGAFSLTHDRTLRASRRSAGVTIGTGTLLGEMALLTETKRPATATATELSNVLRIPRSIFRRTLESYPEAAARLARLLQDRVAETVSGIDGVRRRIERIEPPPRAPRN